MTTSEPEHDWRPQIATAKELQDQAERLWNVPILDPEQQEELDRLTADILSLIDHAEGVDDE